MYNALLAEFRVALIYILYSNSKDTNVYVYTVLRFLVYIIWKPLHVEGYTCTPNRFLCNIEIKHVNLI